MIATSLQDIAGLIVRRAQRQGFIRSREIRQELAQGGLDESRWKEVLALARPALHYRGGRYYYQAPVSARVQQEQSRQRTIHQAVRQLIQQHRAAAERVERREQDRIDFLQPIRVRTEDGRELTLLSRDLSTTGIRLISSRGFLGQKLRLFMPGRQPDAPTIFVVRILWTCAVGDDLYENGGVFVEVQGADTGEPAA